MSMRNKMCGTICRCAVDMHSHRTQGHCVSFILVEHTLRATISILQLPRIEERRAVACII